MNDPITLFRQSLQRMWAGFVAQLPYVILGIVVFIIFYVLGQIVGGVVLKFGRRTRMHGNLALLVSRLASVLVTIFGTLVAAVIMFPTFKPSDLLAGLGVGSVAIGFAFKDILQNFFAGMLILWRHPFSIGDEIKTGNYEGVVENINTRSTRIRTSDGERVILPNGDIYTQAMVVRKAHEKQRLKLAVGIGYADSIEHARQVIHDVLTRIDGVLKEPPPWVYVDDLAPSSVNLMIYLWIDPQKTGKNKVRDAALTGIKEALDGAKIDMPYPHTVVSLLNPQTLSPQPSDPGNR